MDIKHIDDAYAENTDQLPILRGVEAAALGSPGTAAQGSTGAQTIVRMLKSLGARVERLTALEREHARIVPILESHARTMLQLETELEATRLELQAREARAAAYVDELRARMHQPVRLPMQVVEAPGSEATGGGNPDALVAELCEIKRQLAASRQLNAEQEEQIRNLRAYAATVQEEMAVLNLHLRAARQGSPESATPPAHSIVAELPVQTNVADPPAPASKATLALKRIDSDATVCELQGRRTRIGRAPDCEVRIISRAVSRTHAVILNGPRGATIVDIKSTNGVYVNGRKVARSRLADGDSVSIGDVKFRFSSTSASGAAH